MFQKVHNGVKGVIAFGDVKTKERCVFMLEQLKALEERLYILEQEYNLARERHEFLAQHELHEEMKQLRKMHRELKLKMNQS